MNWETLLRYGAGQAVLMTHDAALKAWARRELNQGMQWLANELRMEAHEQMRADDDGMPVSEFRFHRCPRCGHWICACPGGYWPKPPQSGTP